MFAALLAAAVCANRSDRRRIAKLESRVLVELEPHATNECASDVPPGTDAVCVNESGVVVKTARADDEGWTLHGHPVAGSRLRNIHASRVVVTPVMTAEKYRRKQQVEDRTNDYDQKRRYPGYPQQRLMSHLEQEHRLSRKRFDVVYDDVGINPFLVLEQRGAGGKGEAIEIPWTSMRFDEEAEAVALAGGSLRANDVVKITHNPFASLFGDGTTTATVDKVECNAKYVSLTLKSGETLQTVNLPIVVDGGQTVDLVEKGAQVELAEGIRRLLRFNTSGKTQRSVLVAFGPPYYVHNRSGPLPTQPMDTSRLSSKSLKLLRLERVEKEGNEWKVLYKEGAASTGLKAASVPVGDPRAKLEEKKFPPEFVFDAMSMIEYKRREEENATKAAAKASAFSSREWTVVDNDPRVDANVRIKMGYLRHRSGKTSHLRGNRADDFRLHRMSVAPIVPACLFRKLIAKPSQQEYTPPELSSLGDDVVVIPSLVEKSHFLTFRSRDVPVEPCCPAQVKKTLLDEIYAGDARQRLRETKVVGHSEPSTGLCLRLKAGVDKQSAFLPSSWLSVSLVQVNEKAVCRDVTQHVRPLWKRADQADGSDAVLLEGSLVELFDSVGEYHVLKEDVPMQWYSPECVVRLSGEASVTLLASAAQTFEAKLLHGLCLVDGSRMRPGDFVVIEGERYHPVVFDPACCVVEGGADYKFFAGPMDCRLDVAIKSNPTRYDFGKLNLPTPLSSLPLPDPDKDYDCSADVGSGVHPPARYVQVEEAGSRAKKVYDMFPCLNFALVCRSRALVVCRHILFPDGTSISSHPRSALRMPIVKSAEEDPTGHSYVTTSTGVPYGQLALAREVARVWFGDAPPTQINVAVSCYSARYDLVIDHPSGIGPLLSSAWSERGVARADPHHADRPGPVGTLHAHGKLKWPDRAAMKQHYSLMSADSATAVSMTSVATNRREPTRERVLKKILTHMKSFDVQDLNSVEQDFKAYLRELFEPRGDAEFDATWEIVKAEVGRVVWVDAQQSRTSLSSGLRLQQALADGRFRDVLPLSLTDELVVDEQLVYRSLDAVSVLEAALIRYMKAGPKSGAEVRRMYHNLVGYTSSVQVLMAKFRAQEKPSDVTFFECFGKSSAISSASHTRRDADRPDAIPEEELDAGAPTGFVGTAAAGKAKKKSGATTADTAVLTAP